MAKRSYSHFPLQQDGPEAAVRGEKLICRIRIFIFFVFLAYIISFHWLSGFSPLERLMAPIIVSSIWFGINLTLYLVIRLQRFQSWMAIASVFADVATVAALTIATADYCTLNYADNLTFSLYFIAIVLAAIRKKVWVVYMAGVSAALCYLGITLFYQHTLHTTEYDALYFSGNQVASVAFLDQLAKSLALAVVGWTVGHVTAKIKAAQKNYITLFNNVPDGIVLTNGTGAIEIANQSLAEMLQQPLPRIIGQPIHSLFESEYQHNQDNGVITQRTSSTSIPVSITESSLTPRKHNTQKILSVRNLSVQEELREQISLAQKTEALGQIARGLAHDFNNLLGGILGAVSLIRSRLTRLPESGAHGKLQRHAAVIQDCAENARDILKSLLALSRASTRSTTIFEAQKLLGELREFTQKAFGDLYKVSLHIDLDSPLFIEGDENNIFQALLNICLNAKESMSNGGSIGIIARENRPSRDIAISSWLGMPMGPDGTQILELAISDSGHGMDDATQRRCVEPFFSTKETTRRGTGLGLSIAHTIVRHHNGMLNISSVPGAGTVVKIYLPCYAPEERR